jgi:hypothetical protein
MSAKGFGAKPPTKIDKLVEQVVHHAQARYSFGVTS